MRCTIRPGVASGEIRVPTSKSIAHRLLITAALTSGVSVIRDLPLNEDILATIDCLRALNVEIALNGDRARVKGIDVSRLSVEGASEYMFPCRESGSTLRFMIPIAWLTGKKCTFTGAERLFARPLSVYRDIAGQYGFTWVEGHDSLITKGRLPSGTYSFPGNISSQFVTGLMLAAAHLSGETEIVLTGKAESSSYVDLTIEALRNCGYTSEKESSNHYTVHGSENGKPVDMSVPGDHSGAAFFGALNILGGNIKLNGISEDSMQGDRVWQSCFEAIDQGNCELDISDCPDLGPILMAVGALKEGVVLHGTSRLRLKESDRGTAMIRELEKCGVKAEQEENLIRVYKSELHAPAVPFESHNDHRIAMSMAVVSTVTGGMVNGAGSVRKSMPEFWELMKQVGIDITEEEE